eukprot:1932211-Pyramimonas_sp.AAC.2
MYLYRCTAPVPTALHCAVLSQVGPSAAAAALEADRAARQAYALTGRKQLAFSAADGSEGGTSWRAQQPMLTNGHVSPLSSSRASTATGSEIGCAHTPCRIPDPARYSTRSLASVNLERRSLVTGDHSANHAVLRPPLGVFARPNCPRPLSAPVSCRFRKTRIYAFASFRLTVPCILVSVVRPFSLAPCIRAAAGRAGANCVAGEACHRKVLTSDTQTSAVHDLRSENRTVYVHAP